MGKLGDPTKMFRAEILKIYIIFKLMLTLTTMLLHLRSTIINYTIITIITGSRFN